ncbi:hypothetical protein [Haloferula sargassicola]|uniref:hypothetical protein n=1 Tax=Haloferula sargassicola TaxID=490096 RepID=UPI0033656E25
MNSSSGGQFFGKLQVGIELAARVRETRLMRPTMKIRSLSAFVAVFFLGYVLRGAMDSRDLPARELGKRTSAEAPVNEAVETAPRGAGGPWVRERRSSPRYSLSGRQLEAVLTMGMSDPVILFREMGLSEAQIRDLEAGNPAHGLEEKLHAIERRHAAPGSGPDGPVVMIRAFPQDRRNWIESVEERVRMVVDDERSPLLARALIARAGLLESGLFRREIRFIESETGRLDVSERSFDEDGSFYREDYHKCTPDDIERWADLLPRKSQK